MSSSILSEREAIIDTVYRATLGIDTNDAQLFGSACLQNEELTFVMGDVVVNGWEPFFGYTSGHLFTVTTTHYLTSPRVEFKEEGAAQLTVQCVAYHIKPENAFKEDNKAYINASSQTLDVFKVGDGVWKIKKWNISKNWSSGSPANVWD
ncbi:hypothetical protein CANTEDRAFT_114289 [Yamadazyma tenuis ATCC 10573]|uniref:SnoaL-like domain-containing protein n=1 Tax=Candida tenuis (strain ATCC 10573 / BCRC 21748 / CBS 615 / JCM 9827 / NBRC 10315 / NRRL Y-1498 / VKM Y-70) TaxID=590646 RepID=G3B6M5_CANTC|nr:uncharacterized protein CANTEDRAFT_114289 [Yamadazyma tenuis ATCC 10573]EGV62970.1 hypothetical protein CANTEDRAFT_114289 [Yamadazyma tenuis ATCC 10573]